MVPNFGVQKQLTVAVLAAVLLAAVVICAVLVFVSHDRLYEDSIRQAEDTVVAACLAFSQALAAQDEVLLDALIHELQSQEALHIREAYVITPGGRVAAHSRLEEYGKTYAVPVLLKSSDISRLSEVVATEEHGYHIIGLLQKKGAAIGGLVVSFSTGHLSERLQSEILWIVGVTVPILLVSGLGVMTFGRWMVGRLAQVQEKAHAIGRGEWTDPIAISGSDEISDVAQAFNRMQEDLKQFRQRDHQSAKTIETLNEELRAQLSAVQNLKEQLVSENAALREKLRATGASDAIIGEGGGLRPVMEQARQIASLPVTVLVTGESGTGKELLAKFLHQNSQRQAATFVAVNCAAIPETLIESELFGHERGAFTGATGQKKGKFELAQGGTIFLDEIGELPLEAQAKLLRALQEKEISRIGSDRPVSLDVRVIAATNRNLTEEIKRGRFREDLYYRLKVVELHCPPLRNRLEDIPALAQHFVDQYSNALGKPVEGISPSALQLMSHYHWPGNIRELENVIARAVALATTKVLGPSDLAITELPTIRQTVYDAEGDPPVGSPFDKLLDLCGLNHFSLRENGWDKLLDACERLCLKAILAAVRNQKEAAEALGLNATKLHRLVKKHGLKTGNEEPSNRDQLQK